MRFILLVALLSPCFALAASQEADKACMKTLTFNTIEHQHSAADLDELCGPQNENLLEAVNQRAIDQVLELVLEGCDVNAPTESGISVLAQSVSTVTVRDRQAQPGDPSYIKKFPAPEVTLLLLSVGAEVNAADSRTNYTALHHAVQNYFSALSEGQTQDDEKVSNEKASISGVIKVLHMFGANLDAQDYLGNTPLMMAVGHSGDAYRVKLLRDLGSTLTLKNDKGQTALDLARQLGNEEAIRLLE